MYIVYCSSLLLITYHTFCSCVPINHAMSLQNVNIQIQIKDKINIGCLFLSLKLSKTEFILLAVCAQETIYFQCVELN